MKLQSNLDRLEDWAERTKMLFNKTRNFVAWKPLHRKRIWLWSYPKLNIRECEAALEKLTQFWTALAVLYQRHVTALITSTLHLHIYHIWNTVYDSGQHIFSRIVTDYNIFKRTAIKALQGLEAIVLWRQIEEKIWDRCGGKTRDMISVFSTDHDTTRKMFRNYFPLTRN